MISYAVDVYHQWTVLFGVAIFLWGYYFLRPKFGVSAFLLAIYLCFSSLWVWTVRDTRYAHLCAADPQGKCILDPSGAPIPDVYTHLAVKYFALDSMAKMLLIIVPLTFFVSNRRRYFDTGKRVCFWLLIVNSASIIWQFLSRGCEVVNSCGGVIGNPSMSAGLMVCALPLVFHGFRRSWWILALVGIAVVISKSSIAIGLLALFLFVMIGSANIWRAFLMALGVMSVAYIKLGAELFNTSDRLLIWKFMFERWINPVHFVTGTGWGTYKVWGVTLQRSKNLLPAYFWDTAHNDWLQILLEGGIIALFLALAVYTAALRKTYEEANFPVFLSLLLFGVYMAVNPALHFPYPILFGGWLFVFALGRGPLQLDWYKT